MGWLLASVADTGDPAAEDAGEEAQHENPDPRACVHLELNARDTLLATVLARGRNWFLGPDGGHRNHNLRLHRLLHHHRLLSWLSHLGVLLHHWLLIGRLSVFHSVKNYN